MFEVRKNAVALTFALAAAVFVVNIAARAEEKRIAVVNVSDVFARYDRVKDVQDKLQKEYDPQQKKLQENERKLKVWKETIEAEVGMGKDPKKDKPLFADNLKFQQAMFDFQNEYEALLVTVEERRKNEMKQVLAEIRKAISTIGKQEKFDLVLRAPDYAGDFDEKKAGAKDASENISAAELVRRFRDNPVLFFASGVDITEKVILLLNNDYKANPK